MPARSRLSLAALGLVLSAVAPAVTWTIPVPLARQLVQASVDRGIEAANKASNVSPEVQQRALDRMNALRASHEAAAPVSKNGAAGAANPQVGPPAKVPTSGPTVAAKPKASQNWLRKMVSDRLTFTGSRVVGFHSQAVSGDRDAYNSGSYYGRGNSPFTNDGQMTIQGRKVLGILDFESSVADDRIQDPNTRRTTLSYGTGPLSLSYGDIRATLVNTNRFTSFSRTLYGSAAGWQSGRLAIKAVHSRSRGDARTVTIEGSNSAGPYYLQSGRILGDSLDVQLDGQPMVLGQDYALDSEIGAISFLNRTVPPTSVIVATYESQTLSNVGGTIQGGGMAYDFGSFGRLGLSMMEQRGLGTGAAGRVQYFLADTAPGAYYALDAYPVEASLQVAVANVLKDGSSTDYVPLSPANYLLDPQAPFVRLVNYQLLDSQSIRIVYTPKVVQTVVGDRRATGLDWRLPFGRLGKSGFLQVDYADGRSLGSDGTGGIARGASMGYDHGNLHLRSSLRDVPASFVAIESRGFNRNERAWDMGIDYSGGRFTYGLSHSNSAIATQNSDGGLVPARAVNTSGSVRYADPKGVLWSLTQSRSLADRLGETRLDTTSLTGAKSFLGGKFDLNVGLDRQTGRGPIANGTALTTGDVEVSTARTGFDWRLGGGLSANGRVGFSRVATPVGSGSGHDTSLSLAYRPSDRWTFAATRLDSDSGQAAALSGFSTGFGYGYGGNGFSGGTLGTGFSLGATSLRSNQLTADFRPTDRLSLAGRLYQSRSEGGYSSNADVLGYGLAMNLDLGRFQSLSLSFDRTRTSYLAGATGVSGSGSALTISDTASSSYSLSYYANPKGRVNYSLAYTGFLTTGSLGFSGASSAFYDLNLGYRLADRQRISFGYSQSLARGYYGLNESLASAAYEYRLYGSVALRGIYRWRNVANVTGLTSGAYRSRGLDLELSFDFGR